MTLPFLVDPIDSWQEWGIVGVIIGALLSLAWYSIKNGRKDTLSAVAAAQASSDAFLAYVQRSAGETAVIAQQANAASRENTDALRTLTKGMEILAAEQSRAEQRAMERHGALLESQRHILDGLQTVCRNGHGGGGTPGASS